MFYNKLHLLPTLIIYIDTHLLIYHIVKVHTSLPCGNVATRHNLVIVLTMQYIDVDTSNDNVQY